MAKKPNLATSFLSRKKQKQAQSKRSTSWADLLSIRPDPAQPRSLLPPDLAQSFEGGELDAQAVIKAWQERAPDNPALADLQRLADSIAQHGLINPISVRENPAGEADTGITYLIVTGERRWWAHVLLLAANREIQEGETLRKPDQIKITLTAQGISVRAHQLIENLIRSDLGAIEKAEGVWALRYELSNIDPNSPSPDSKLVPWKEVEQSLGISGRYRRFITSVMSLSDEVQALIQQHHLSEYAVRPITKLKDHPALQQQALQQLLTWQQEGEDVRSLNKSLNDFVDGLLTKTIKKEEASAAEPVQEEEVTQRDKQAPEAEPAQSRPLAELQPKAALTSKPPQMATLQSHAEQLLALLDELNPDDNNIHDELLSVHDLVIAIQNRLKMLLP